MLPFRHPGQQPVVAIRPRPFTGHIQFQSLSSTRPPGQTCKVHLECHKKYTCLNRKQTEILIIVSTSSKQFRCAAPVRSSEIFRRVSGRFFHIIGRGTSLKQHCSGCFLVSERITEQSSGTSCGDAVGRDAALQASSWAYCQDGLL